MLGARRRGRGRRRPRRSRDPDGRILARTDRGEEPFEDLSHGERWRWALDVFARGGGRDSLLVCQQEGWEGLDPENRTYVARMCRERGVQMFTAEADGGELRAEVVE